MRGAKLSRMFETTGAHCSASSGAISGALCPEPFSILSRSAVAESSVNISSALVKVFVEIGGSGEARQRLPFAALGRQKQNLAVASLDIGGENRRDALAGHRFGKNQVAVVEIELDVFFIETQVADAIALVGIQACVSDGARSFRGGRTRGPSGQRQDQKEYSSPNHFGI